MASKFKIPGVFTSTTDLTVASSSSAGITTLGLVGETLKGPAFEPIFIQGQSDFTSRFGAQSPEKFSNGVPKYEAAYIANEYLKESNQLYVTRVLGLSGYNAGKAWGIVASAGLDLSTVTLAATVTGTTTFTSTSTTTTFANAGIEALKDKFSTLPINALNSGATFTIESGATLNKTSNVFSASGITLNVISTTGNTGTATFTVKRYTGSGSTATEGMVLAVLRSRGSYDIDTLKFATSAVTISNTALVDPTKSFTLTTNGVNTYDVSLNEKSEDFITKVIGTNQNDKKANIFVEEINSKLLNSLYLSGEIYGIKATLVELPELDNADYISQFKTPETPWIVSQLNGNNVERLFKVITISDGNNANKEVKVSFTNINFDSREFDILVRDFNDTDAKPVILESFTRCTLQVGSLSYVGAKIGTSDGEYALKSKFIYLEMNVNASSTAVPAGFEGYETRNYGTGVTPRMLYKASYDALDKVNKVYLGLSDKVGIDQTKFNYFGEKASLTKTEGFHMDSGATLAGKFIVGKHSFKKEADLVGTEIERPRDRKFTICPAGGFDGWDIYRTERTNRDFYQNTNVKFANANFTEANPSDYYAYLEAYHIYDDPKDISLNLFATPGIDYERNLSLVNEVIELVEDVRGDCLYITTTPDQDDTNASAETMADVINSAQLDSSYTCTYGPWIQHFDKQNSVNIFLPPTAEAVRNMAYTDRIKGSWFAPAGFERGTINAKRARIKLNDEKAITLHEAKINPIRSYGADGLKIFGQKTLQVQESALDRIQVRRLMLQLSKAISNIALRLVFEPNDTTLMSQFNTLVNPVLNNIKIERGVYDFLVICDSSINTPESIDRLELNAIIKVKPTRAAEFINVNFELTPTGTSFTV